MPIRHVAKRGESVESIAFHYGFFWETVWNAPENQALREQRQQPNLLLEGGVVVVPDKRVKTVLAAGRQVHRFRLKGVPSRLSVRLLRQGEPRAGLAYTVEVPGGPIRGVTDPDGWIKCWLMPDVREGVLKLDDTGECFDFEVGTVGPSETVLGAQSRLRNLGYYRGPMDGRLGPDTVAALEAFQGDRKLAVTGEADADTFDALRQAHGS
jgi:N-acetylmuramoyl-L-alanine amidase